jgi:hypothetical protein
MTIAKRKSSTDDKVEVKRKIIRRSLAEITTEVEIELRRANLRGGINMIVPSRHTLLTIAGPTVASEEWSGMSQVVRQVVAKRLGGSELRGRPLACAVATALADVADVPRE